MLSAIAYLFFTYYILSKNWTSILASFLYIVNKLYYIISKKYPQGTQKLVLFLILAYNYYNNHVRPIVNELRKRMLGLLSDGQGNNDNYNVVSNEAGSVMMIKLKGDTGVYEIMVPCKGLPTGHIDVKVVDNSTGNEKVVRWPRGVPFSFIPESKGLSVYVKNLDGEWEEYCTTTPNL